MMRMIALVLLLSLSACATTAPVSPEPRIVVERVNVPIPVPCKVDLGANPEYPDTDAALAAAPGIFVLVQLYKAGRILRQARERELKAAAQACAG